MSLNCASCGDLIEDKPFRKGGLFFCDEDCYADYVERTSEVEDSGPERERKRD